MAPNPKSMKKSYASATRDSWTSASTLSIPLDMREDDYCADSYNLRAPRLSPVFQLQIRPH